MWRPDKLFILSVLIIRFFQMGATGQEDQQKVLQDLNIMVC